MWQFIVLDAAYDLTLLSPIQNRGVLCASFASHRIFTIHFEIKSPWTRARLMECIKGFARGPEWKWQRMRFVYWCVQLSELCWAATTARWNQLTILCIFQSEHPNTQVEGSSDSANIRARAQQTSNYTIIPTVFRNIRTSERLWAYLGFGLWLWINYTFPESA